MEQSAHCVLSVNSGSSSIKFTCFRMDDRGETPVLEGAAEEIGLPEGRLWLRDADGREVSDGPSVADHRSAFAAAFAAMRKELGQTVDAIGHRVVHGGPSHERPELVTTALLEQLESLIPLAPLHIPPAVEGIRAAFKAFPGVPQVACFDTAFHRRMPVVTQRLPLPEDLWEKGIRRYGFHGLSYEYILQCLGDDAGGRVIIAHLGNGASLAAVRDSEPVDTTMGFTPAGGVMMGTRSGDLDPGVLIYLLKHQGYDADDLERLVEHRAGLVGVSGSTSDMAELLERRDTDERAGLAIDMFVYQIRKQIGAFAAALGGVDRLVFTGGIGEHAASVRAAICAGLDHLGVCLDPARNEAHARDVSTPDSTCRVNVIPTDEARMIARHTKAIMGRSRESRVES